MIGTSNSLIRNTYKKMGCPDKQNGEAPIAEHKVRHQQVLYQQHLQKRQEG
jgi:hypothetical protein